MTLPSKAKSATKPFGFGRLLRWLREAIVHFPDKRAGKNTQYKMLDVALGAFSVFFTQSPSFLAHQDTMKQARGKSNAQTIFEMLDIPTDDHIRDMLDHVTPDHLFPVFSSAFEALNTAGHLEPFRSVNNTLLIALDGTQYHSSNTIHCTNCSCKIHQNGTITYSHVVVTPAIVAPGNRVIFPMEPEFVTPQDGHAKQDCETAAAKRWVTAYAPRYKSLGVTVLGDDIYCHQPLCQLTLDKGLHFIFVCKPESHKTLYKRIGELDELQAVDTVVTESRHGKQRKIHTYRFVNEVPLRDGDEALMVNWCEITTTRPDGTGEYHNSFASDHTISKENVAEVVAAGRARWKIENENNNTLKTKGYHLTHNYGHGKQHLSSLLATMNILAYLFHTLLHIGDERYRLLRQKLRVRKLFFDDLRALTRYICFDTWDDLLTFMMEGLEIEVDDTS